MTSAVLARRTETDSLGVMRTGAAGTASTGTSALAAGAPSAKASGTTSGPATVPGGVARMAGWIGTRDMGGRAARRHEGHGVTRRTPAITIDTAGPGRVSARCGSRCRTAARPSGVIWVVCSLIHGNPTKAKARSREPGFWGLRGWRGRGRSAPGGLARQRRMIVAVRAGARLLEQRVILEHPAGAKGQSDDTGQHIRNDHSESQHGITGVGCDRVASFRWRADGNELYVRQNVSPAPIRLKFSVCRSKPN
ncbi:hypothetical protein D3C87_1396800 [compost metagenome]